MNEPCWFAARCFGEAETRYPHQVAPNQFAHTNILMVTMAGRTPTSACGAVQFIDEIDALIKFARDLPSRVDATACTDTVQRRLRQYYAGQI